MTCAYPRFISKPAGDPREFQPHHTNKENRRKLAERFKDAASSLQLVIVRDMWLTGFDVPCLHTMYVDKLMRGHNLMQTIARVNRVYRDKPGGLIVDYIGFAADLQKALAVYTQSGGTGDPITTQEEAIEVMMGKYEVVKAMFHGFDYVRYFAADTHQKLGIILEAQEHILACDTGEERKGQNAKERFIKEVMALSQSFALAVPSEASMEIRDEVGFFQAVKARLVKFEPEGGTRTIDAESPDFMRAQNQRLRRTRRLFCQTNQWLAVLMIHRCPVARAPSLRPAPGSADDGSVPAETPSPHES